jgi:hypothetical protein
MILGVDFDNTLVSYDAIFHRVALERGLIPTTLPVTKIAVRDHLRATGREPFWTEMQGYVYGPRLADAEPFPGVKEFFCACQRNGVPIFIISHKTRHPVLGEAHDLHAAARGWLQQHGFHDPAGAALPESHVFLEVTKADKIARIAACGCTCFVDDLPDILRDPGFPAQVNKLLFGSGPLPAGINDLRQVSSWAELLTRLTAEWTAATSLSRRAQGLARLGNALGYTAPLSLSPLAGGANNRIHLVRPATGHAFITKEYFSPAGDTRDRFRSEQAFFTFAWQLAGLRTLPAPLGWDYPARLGAFALIDGLPVTAATPAAVDEALDFVATLNRFRDQGEALPLASEACFSLAEHLATVDRRLGRLLQLDAADTIALEALDFVRTQLQPAWERVRLAPELDAACVAESIGEVLPRCISPSDFGFHNTMRRSDGHLVFLDFEYAGWDDPAKLVCDFFCQPAVPVPHAQWAHFITRLADALGCPVRALANRCRLLLPVYQLKWCIIMLNEFLPAGDDRRRFAGAGDMSERQLRQLTKARCALAQVGCAQLNSL